MGLCPIFLLTPRLNRQNSDLKEFSSRRLSSAPNSMFYSLQFKPGELEPALTFGHSFQPGPGVRHLCMPTSIAVASTGEIFIADGYCNNRILKFNAAGGLLRIIPNPPGSCRCYLCDDCLFYFIGFLINSGEYNAMVNLMA